MKFEELNIPGVYTISMEPFTDHRGSFARTFCSKEFAACGLETTFVQMNHSKTTMKGTIRGMHYQRAPHSEVKLVRCIRGKVLDVIIDLRKDSSSWGQHIAVELSALNELTLYIPRGFAHGFQTLSENVELLYQHSSYYHPEAESGIHYADPRFNIQWPLPVSSISKKDKLLTFVSDAFKGIQT
ncbi:MAG: dTDP-4-dehydrorhamnose 3,5-epimerase [Saprospiraceae bacterium]|nr:dTDP-4-dehydrorhamnose 3,5-epimerase [Saprospiraceae bacterium]